MDRAAVLELELFFALVVAVVSAVVAAGVPSRLVAGVVSTVTGDWVTVTGVLADGPPRLITEKIRIPTTTATPMRIPPRDADIAPPLDS